MIHSLLLNALVVVSLLLVELLGIVKGQRAVGSRVLA